MPSVDMSALTPDFRANFAAADAVAGDGAFTFALYFVVMLIVIAAVVVVAIAESTASPGWAVISALLALVLLWGASRAGGLYAGTVDLWREVRASV
jgi:hypothetical protein